ncbi:class I SAM-dependent methyltransferase [Myxococcota bacterium]|nr:class I SAM-dependent methyltransferase [Myxococcota bacterium]MBU1379298.1 class I SAM-dependent methyltransferase [Myxococcota bacterium]MBU1497869.1 class I SAM-dependent methyltransferase [Myxococcota bacterium]
MESIFDKSAASWDDKPERIKMAQNHFNSIVNTFNFSKTTVLDYGCGTGLLSIPLSRICKEVHAWDSSVEMRHVITEKIKKENISNIKVAGFEEEINSYKHNYNYVLMSMMLHHVDDYHSHLKKMKELLLPGGLVVVIDLAKEDGGFHKDNTGVFHFGFSTEDMFNAFEFAGYSDCQYSVIQSVERESKDNTLKSYDIFLASGRNNHQNQTS